MRSVCSLIRVVFFGLFLSLVLPNGPRVAMAQEVQSGPVIRISAPVQSIDWHQTLDLASARVILSLMHGLTAFDADDKLVPALAEKWTTSSDSKSFKFFLRKNVVWSDGVPLVAQHFVDAIIHVLDPKTGAIGSSAMWMIAGAKDFNKGVTKDASQVGVRALSAHVLEFNLVQPSAYLPALMAHTISLPARLDVIKKHGDKWTRPENLVVLGPYKLESWKSESFTLVANSTFYGAKPTVPRYTFRVVQEDSTALDLFKNGNLDIIYNPPRTEWPSLRLGSTFKTFPNIRVLSMAFNVTKAPFDNPKVRRAFAYATDRSSIVKLFDPRLRSGEAPIYRPVNSWIPDGVPGFNPALGLAFNPELARKELAAAGYPLGKGLPKIELSIDSRDENRILAERLQAQWNEVLGVKIDLAMKESGGYRGQLRTDPPQIFRFGIGAVYLDPDLFARIFIEEAGLNYGRWKNKKYDELVARAAGQSKIEKRKPFYDQAQKVLLEEDAALIPISQEAMPMLVSNQIENFAINCQGVPLMQFAKVTPKK